LAEAAVLTLPEVAVVAYHEKTTPRLILQREPYGQRSVAARPVASSARPRARAREAGRPAVKGASRRSSARSGDGPDDDGEPPGTDAGRKCVVCGDPIPARTPSGRRTRRDAKTCGKPRCRKRLERRLKREREAEQLQWVAAMPCRCGLGAIPFPDPDGDALCAKCGHYVAVGGRVNGHNYWAGVMAANGVRAWRPWRQPECWKTYVPRTPLTISWAVSA
jgi:hypothetical protein